MATDLTGRTDILMLWVDLTPTGRAALLAAFPPVHERKIADHMTVAFKPTPAELASFVPGMRVSLIVTGYAEDEKGQAVLVEGYPSRNAFPHITVSVSQDTKPVYSNQLMEAGYEELDGSVVLEGVTVAVTKRQEKILS